MGTGTATQVATYAGNGNIASKRYLTASGWAGASSFTYDPAHPHAVMTGAGMSVTYDANGNALTRARSGHTTGIEWAGFDKPRWMATQRSADVVGSAFQYGPDRMGVVQDQINGLNKPDAADPTTWSPSSYNEKRLYVEGTMELDYALASGSWSMDAVRIHIPAPGGNAHMKKAPRGCRGAWGICLTQRLLACDDQLMVSTLFPRFR